MNVLSSFSTSHCDYFLDLKKKSIKKLNSHPNSIETTTTKKKSTIFLSYQMKTMSNFCVDYFFLGGGVL